MCCNVAIESKFKATSRSSYAVLFFSVSFIISLNSSWYFVILCTGFRRNALKGNKWPKCSWHSWKKNLKCFHCISLESHMTVLLMLHKRKEEMKAQYNWETSGKVCTWQRMWSTVLSRAHASFCNVYCPPGVLIATCTPPSPPPPSDQMIVQYRSPSAFCCPNSLPAPISATPGWRDAL